MKFLFLFFSLFFFAGTVSAQKYLDTLLPPGKDTIVFRQYTKNGQLTKTRNWVGDPSGFSKDFHSAGITEPMQMDTLDVIAEDTVLIRKYGDDGRLKWEALEVGGEEILYRDYYYDDTTWGYTEMDPRIKNSPYLAREYYLDSTPRILGKFSGNKEEGSYLTFHRNGNPQCICYYKHGKREGMQHTYHDNGKPWMVATYRNGEKDGKCTIYYKNGNAQSVETYSNGLETDTAFYYYEDGTAWSTVIYKDGAAYNVMMNNSPDGKPQDKGTLIDGNGTRKVYDEKGILSDIEEFKNGKLVKVRKVKSSN